MGPAAPIVGPNPNVIEMTTRSSHDGVVALKDKYPVVVEDVDQTFGNFNTEEARKARHMGQQYIALKTAAGGKIDTLGELADMRGAELKQYEGLLRGLGGQERKAVNETRQVAVPQNPGRTPGLLDRFLHRTGAKPQ